jgi:hypothetical protein
LVLGPPSNTFFEFRVLALVAVEIRLRKLVGPEWKGRNSERVRLREAIAADAYFSRNLRIGCEDGRNELNAARRAGRHGSRFQNMDAAIVCPSREGDRECRLRAKFPL